MDSPDTPREVLEPHAAAEAGNTMPDRTPEFTPRAILVGSLIGALVMAANIYMGLKIGFIEGYAILSAILCFAIVRVFGGRLSMLENNIGQTLPPGLPVWELW